ncbi:MAG: S8 family serine peptidase [Phycisphaerae bacterium]|nr:S8 family serine peptidase [Phycisphaerae bacterium]NUQ45793.1 S8 family serine peptidase [Phycisphaerae bacterium]
MNRRYVSLALCFAVAFLAVPSLAADQPVPASVATPLEPDALYLRVGTVTLDANASLHRTAAAPLANGGWFVIQLDGPLSPQRQSALADVGVRVGQYLPSNAFIVRLERGYDTTRLTRLPFVRWLGAYQQAWKLDPEIGRPQYATPERQAMAQRGEFAILVTLFDGEPVAAVVPTILGLKGAVVHWTESPGDNELISATIRRADLPAIAAIETVQFVEEASELTPRNDTDRWIVQSNILNVTPLYTNGIHGEGQIVGVLDTKLDINHCMFRDTVPIGPNHRKILAYNTSTGAQFHGTHVSGTVAGDNGVNDNTRGVAYLSKIVFNDIPSFTETAMNTSLTTHHNQGGRVHTNSWGDDGTTAYNSLCRGIDLFQRNNEDSLVLFAVTNLSLLKNPENAKNLVAVGASQDAPSQANHCSGGAGPTSDGRRKPEIYAPGCATNSASSGTACNVTTATGTSMACPAVAGSAMLIRQYYTDGYYPTGFASPSDGFLPTSALVKATLLNSAVDMTGITGYPSNQEGWGRVLLDNALYLPSDTRKLVAYDVRNADGLTTGQEVEYQINVLGNSQPLKITLVYTDVPATSGAAQAWINDLDLEVVAPDNTLYRGNVFTNGQSSSGGVRDDRNNVEQVHRNSPGVGVWIVRVRAFAVNQGGPQGYAVVATGDIQAEIPPLSIHLPNGAPTEVSPVNNTDFVVRITPGSENIVPGSPTLHHRVAGDTAFQTSPLTSTGGNNYLASLPPADCGQTLEFYLSAEGDAGSVVTEPADAPTTTYSATLDSIVTLFSDNFETDTGWTVDNAAGTGGAWERGIPIGGGGAPSTDYDGSGRCYVTGRLSGDDVDGGPVRVISPIFDLSGAVDPTIRFARWFYNNNQDIDRLTAAISNNGGQTWVILEQATHAPSWSLRSFRIRDYVTLTSQVRLRFSVADQPNNSTTEAAVDAVSIIDDVCASVPCLKGDINNDGVVDGDDTQRFVELLIQGGGSPYELCAGDVQSTPNGSVGAEDVANFVECLLAGGCP